MQALHDMPSGPQGLDFDQLQLGSTVHSQPWTVDEPSIAEFARAWDPQPYHVDPEAAKTSVFSTLVASGLHVLALTYRLHFNTGLIRGTGLAGVGIDRVRFLGPLRPGDTVRVAVTVQYKRRTRKAGRGLVVFRMVTANQYGQDIFSMDLLGLVRRNSA